MASKTFNLRTEPHEAVLGDTTLLFVPEVTGPEFATAYDALKSVQLKAKNAEGMAKALGKKGGKPADDDAGLSKELLVELSDAMREFIRTFLTDEMQRDTFDNMRLPDRILSELMQFCAELYGGGSGNDDAGGSSSD